MTSIIIFTTTITIFITIITLPASKKRENGD